MLYQISYRKNSVGQNYKQWQAAEGLKLVWQQTSIIFVILFGAASGAEITCFVFNGIEHI